MPGSFERQMLDRTGSFKEAGLASPAASDMTLVRSRDSSLDWSIGNEKRDFNMEEEYRDESPSSGYSSYTDMQKEKARARRRTPRSPRLPEDSSFDRCQRYLKSRNVLLGAALAAVIFVTYHVFSSRQHGTFRPRPLDRPTRHIPFFADKYEHGEANNGAWPLSTRHGPPSELCDICDCHAQPSFYGPKPDFAAWYPPRPRIQDVYPDANTIDRNEYMRQTVLDIYCSRQHMTTAQSTKIVRRAGTHFDEMVAWNISGLELGKKTIYLTTATSPNGKADVLRPQYFRRHGRAIRTWLAQQEVQAREKGIPAEWQIVWVISEDEVDIDPQIVRTLQRTGLSFIYFAYGLTRSWGNAQKNANMQVVHALSRPLDHGGILGHGPVYGLDDDNKMLPDLMTHLIRVDRLGVFPMGNLGADGFEAPIVNDLGEVVDSESLWMFRKYPFDFGGFSFNSSLLGTVISGPMFWKHTDFAGESEFFEQIISNIKELEPLCGRQQEQECHMVWHNEPLTDMEQLTDNEELAYIERFGVEKWYDELQRQLMERDTNRAEWYQPPVGDWEVVEEVDDLLAAAPPSSFSSGSSSSSSSGGSNQPLADKAKDNEDLAHANAKTPADVERAESPRM